MNLYIRYFDHETVAHNLEEVVAFLSTITDVKVDSNAIDRIVAFADSDATYPFRLKVSYSNYILFLKTDAPDIEAFRVLEQQRKAVSSDGMTMAERKRSQLEALNRYAPGWYEATITFKRVVLNPETCKCQYIDTPFSVRTKADSVMHCYTRVIDYLRSRQDIDNRSQFPSVKSDAFVCRLISSESTESVPVEMTSPEAIFAQ